MIRAELYRDAGGLSGFYDKPSIEDIELGGRLAAQGVEIRIFPSCRSSIASVGQCEAGCIRISCAAASPGCG